MDALLAAIPAAIAAALWAGLHRLNRRLAWFRTGELIFWDTIFLILIYLVWLRWF